MRQYSVIEAFTFASSLPEKELKAAFDKFIERLESGREYMRIYRFTLLSAKGGLIYEYELDMDDSFAKHYAEEHLARFVSEVIASGHHALITLTGEDGGQRGYLIFQNKVHNVSYGPTVEGMSLEKFLRLHFRNKK